MARGGKRSELLTKCASFVEQLVRPVALYPIFKLLEMFGALEIRERDLMRAPGTLDRLAVDEFRPRPTLGRAENDHRPARTLQAFGLSAGARLALNLAKLHQNRIERSGE